MKKLQLHHISSKIGNFALDDINLAINSGEYFVLLGQSGSGKTKLLESIAGVHPCEGTIYFEGGDISKVAVENREFGFVYQSFALFPNMNVKDNITFAKRYKKIEGAKENFDDLVEFLRLEKLLDRDIDHLSGGEKQRVALARALYSKPKLLLLDEPLSAVDPTFRNAIMKSLKDIHQRFDLTTIHVTHNFREASFLADTIAIIIQGRIRQVGRAKEVLNNPASIEIAQFLGFKNIFDAGLLGERGCFTIDPNVIRVSKSDNLSCEYIFKGVMEQCMGIVDHYKLFVRVAENVFFIKILNREYDGCYTKDQNSVYIGFNRADVAFL